MINALTIDVEDYFQVSAFESVVRVDDWDRYESRVEANTHRILDLLDETGTKATFFVLGWIAERQPKLVRAIHNRGHEIASHGYAHQRVTTQTPELFLQETRRAKSILENLIGQPVVGYRAASYSITAQTLWALDLLLQEGFLYDSSIFPIRHDHYGIPSYHRFPVKHDIGGGRSLIEFPLTTVRLGPMNVPIAGGAYLRFLPYRFIEWGISHVNQAEQQPAIVYLHPWELDPHQPRIRSPFRSRLRHYTNLHRTEAVLKRLLSTFTFGRVTEALAAGGIATSPGVAS